MVDGNGECKKRKFQAFSDDKYRCESINKELNLLLDKRIKDVDAYVANELETLRVRELRSRQDHDAQLASIGEREAALAAKDAELESLCKKLQQREAAIDAKSSQLQGLRAEILPLYDKLRTELPDLQARANLAAKVHQSKQVAPTPGENSGSRLYQRQQAYRSCIAAAQPQEQSQQHARVDADGVLRQSHKAAVDIDPPMDSAAPVPGPLSSMPGKMEARVQWDASASRRPSLRQTDASRGKPACPAPPEACRPHQEQGSDHLRPSAFAEVGMLGAAAHAQHRSTQAAHFQQEHAQADAEPHHTSPAQHTQKPPQHNPCAQQRLFRPVVQQQRAAPKHNADSQPAAFRSANISLRRKPATAERIMPKAAFAVHLAEQHAQKAMPSQPAKIRTCTTQGVGKANRRHPRIPNRHVGRAATGEVDELNGLVTSLKAQRPVLDEPRKSAGILDAAACSGDDHDHDHGETPAGAPNADKQASLPNLVSTLKEQHSLSSSALLQTSSDESGNKRALYEKVHGILSQYMSHHPAPGAAPDDETHYSSSSPIHSSTPTSEDINSSSRYSPNALAILVKIAEQYQANGEPVTWGWCTELAAFVFVFETANRIVVEEPRFRHATYFYEIEEPLPVSCQVQRLIAVLSVPSIGRSALLHDKAPCFARDLPLLDKAVLMSAGWTEEGGLRALLNFSGERVVHISDGHGAACNGETWERYRERLCQILSQGRAKGRLYKSAQHSAWAQG